MEFEAVIFAEWLPSCKSASLSVWASCFLFSSSLHCFFFHSKDFHGAPFAAWPCELLGIQRWAGLSFLSETHTENSSLFPKCNNSRKTWGENENMDNFKEVWLRREQKCTGRLELRTLRGSPKAPLCVGASLMGGVWLHTTQRQGWTLLALL